MKILLKKAIREEIEKIIKEESPWYVQQHEIHKELSLKNKKICEEIKEYLPIYAKKTKSNIFDIGKIFESLRFPQPNQYSISFKYDQQSGNKYSDYKGLKCELEVREKDKINGMVAGASYFFGSDPKSAVKNYLEYINKVPSNRL